MDKFTQYFIDKYSKNIPYGFYIECGEGWKELLEKAFEIIKDKDIQVAQIKEKFGTLRFYTEPHNYDIQTEIYKIEDESASVCESCGSRENVTREGSWIKTFCKSCREKRFKKD
jgi:hypothetical protein